METILIYFAIKYKNDFIKIYEALKNKDRVYKKELKIINNRLESGDIEAITILSENYPEEFKLQGNPPFVIWIKEPKELKGKVN